MKRTMLAVFVSGMLAFGASAYGKPGGGFSGSRSSFSGGSSRSSGGWGSSSRGSGWGGSSGSSKSSGWGSSSRSGSSSGGWGKSSSTPSLKSSWGSSGNSSGWGKSTAPSTTIPKSSGGWGSSSRGGSSGYKASSHSAADRALYTRSKQQGTLFKSRTEAQTHFQQKYSTQYTTKFKAEPTVRPTYVPRTYLVGNRTVNVVYSPVYGGYGYYHPLTGSWLMYDVMRDAAMLSVLMSNHGYYYGAPPAEGYVAPAFAWLWLVLGGFFLLFIVVGLIAFARSR